MVTGFLMMRPSAASLRIVCRELALEISLTSLGSSQILRWPQPRTDAARRFWVLRLTLQPRDSQHFELELEFDVGSFGVTRRHGNFRRGISVWIHLARIQSKTSLLKFLLDMNQWAVLGVLTS
jgi:hypothetical protein